MRQGYGGPTVHDGGTQAPGRGRRMGCGAVVKAGAGCLQAWEFAASDELTREL